MAILELNQYTSIILLGSACVYSSGFFLQKFMNNPYGLAWLLYFCAWFLMVLGLSFVYKKKTEDINVGSAQKMSDAIMGLGVVLTLILYLTVTWDGYKKYIAEGETSVINMSLFAILTTFAISFSVKM